MKVCQISLICLCMFGATQLALGQTKEPAAPAIRGYLDPTTGKFTTRIPSGASTQGAAVPRSATQTGTSIFFREDFQISVFNYDQPSGATAICSVTMSTFDDANGALEEDLSVAAQSTGSGWSCDVPVLTQWTLQTPSQDTISADVSIAIYTQSSPVPLYRGSYKTYTLAVPGNTETVVTSVGFAI